MTAAINKIEPVIREREAEMAVGISDHYSQSDSQKIPELWNEFVKRKDQIQNVKPGYTLGICESSTSGAIPDDTFVYTAAVPVDRVDEVPSGMVLCKIPPGRYAVFTHKGSLANLPNTLGYIHGSWLLQSGFKRPNGQTDILHFELYTSRFDPHSKGSEMEIYVPIQ